MARFIAVDIGRGCDQSAIMGCLALALWQNYRTIHRFADPKTRGANHHGTCLEPGKGPNVRPLCEIAIAKARRWWSR